MVTDEYIKPAEGYARKSRIELKKSMQKSQS